MSEIDNDLKYMFDSYEINYPVDDLFTEAEIKKNCSGNQRNYAVA